MAAVEEVPTAQAEDKPTPLTSSTVPAGYTIEYFVEPKRAYHIDGVEVPSVTTVLGCLDKGGGLTWWAQKIGAQGVLDLFASGDLIEGQTGEGKGRLVIPLTDWSEYWPPADADAVVRLLTEHKISVNHQRDKAGVRGVGAHNAFEAWAITGKLPRPENHPVEEQGYVTGLLEFCKAMGDAWETEGVEVTVGSKEHGFAGRYDLRGRVNRDVRLVAKATTQAGKPLASGPKFTTIPAGTSLLVDLKSSKSIYATHLMQLEAYEGAGVECGYKPTDARAVIHVTADGLYQVKRAKATYPDFLAVLRTFNTLIEVKKALA